MADTGATLDVLSDDALALRIASGPPGSTSAEEGELHRRYAPRVRVYGRGHLRDEAAADDLAQEVLLVAIEQLRAGGVPDPEGIGPFVLRVSRTMTQADGRVARHREARASRVPAAGSGTASSASAALDAPRVAVCLRTLGEGERLVVLTTFYAGQEAEGIAADLGMSSSAVRALRQQAMARLLACVLGAGQT